MLYLIDNSLADVGLRTATDDPDAHVVLIQDGVYLAGADDNSDLVDMESPVSAVAKDVDVRGVELPPEIDRISYDRLMELIVEQEVRSFV